jgi:hypothetical protein
VKRYAYVKEFENDTEVDWSRVCDRDECQRFPNRCDHLAPRRLMLAVIQPWESLAAYGVEV